MAVDNDREWETVEELAQLPTEFPPQPPPAPPAPPPPPQPEAQSAPCRQNEKGKERLSTTSRSAERERQDVWQRTTALLGVPVHRIVSERILQKQKARLMAIIRDWHCKQGVTGRNRTAARVVAHLGHRPGSDDARRIRAKTTKRDATSCSQPSIVRLNKRPTDDSLLFSNKRDKYKVWRSP